MLCWCPIKCQRLAIPPPSPRPSQWCSKLLAIIQIPTTAVSPDMISTVIPACELCCENVSLWMLHLFLSLCSATTCLPTRRWNPAWSSYKLKTQTEWLSYDPASRARFHLMICLLRCEMVRPLICIYLIPSREQKLMRTMVNCSTLEWVDLFSVLKFSKIESGTVTFNTIV